MNVYFREGTSIPNHIQNLIRHYREYLKFEKGNTPCTISHKVRSIKRFFRDAEIKSLIDVNENVFQDFFYHSASSNDWSPSTWNNNWSYLRCFCDWAIQRKHTPWKKNPVISLNRPKRPKLVPRRLSKEDLNKIFSVCFTFPWSCDVERLRNIAILTTMLYCGVRMNELLHIKVNHVNLSSNILYIEKGKGQKSRSLPIPLTLKRFLTDYSKAANKKFPSREFYFASLRSGKKLCHKDIYLIKKKITQISGVYFTPHQLRHTFASISVEQSIPLPLISKAMGHTSILHTESYLSPDKGLIHDLYANFDPFR